jgi:hypothetical protein
MDLISAAKEESDPDFFKNKQLFCENKFLVVWSGVWPE